MKRIFIFKANACLMVVFWLFVPWMIQAASPPLVDVSGKVTDDNGEPLIGVNVLVKNTTSVQND